MAVYKMNPDFYGNAYVRHLEELGPGYVLWTLEMDDGYSLELFKEFLDEDYEDISISLVRNDGHENHLLAYGNGYDISDAIKGFIHDGMYMLYENDFETFTWVISRCFIRMCE